MKGLSLFNKTVFVINTIFVLLLLVACALPYITLSFLSFLSFLSLAVPVLVAVNVLFFLYWAVQRKKQMMPSLFILFLSYLVLGTFVKLDFSEGVFPKDDLTVMSYNVRGFDRWGSAHTPHAFQDIESLIAHEKPDIICFQEVGYHMKAEYLDYPYHYLQKIDTVKKVHLGFFSKYAIVNAETIHFTNSINNGSYADIDYNGDTLRIYNVHMQSLGITPGTGVLRKNSSDRLFKKVNKRFKRQQQQANIIEAHKSNSPYKTILCGDFNNTQFSNVYHSLKGDMRDSFIEEGTGFGRTYDLFGIPFRIDFILADEGFKIMGHKNYDLKYSDHFPVMASFRLKE